MAEGGYLEDAQSSSTASPSLTESEYDALPESDQSPSLHSMSEIPEFVKTIPQRYKCNECKRVAQDPTQSECGHTFCKACIEHYFDTHQGTTVCPTPEYDDCQRVTRKGLFLDKGTLREIQNQEVYCSNKSLGCTKTMIWAELGAHLEEDCLKSRINCRECSKKIRREKMGHHLHQDCPKRIRNCCHSRIGCAFKGTKEQLQQHEKDDMGNHIMLCNFSYCQQDLKLQELQTEVHESKEEIRILRVKNENLQKEKKAFLRQQKESSKKMQKLEKQVAEQKGKIKDLEDDKVLNETFLTKSCQTDSQQASRQFEEKNNCSGELVWKIKDYTRRKQDAVAGRILSLESVPFYTSKYGYKMCARVYLNGDGSGKGTHLSIFFVVMKGEYDAKLPWPFRQKVTLMLLAQDLGRPNLSDTFTPDPSCCSFRRPLADTNVAFGPWEVGNKLLKKNYYIKDDTLIVKVVTEKL